MSRVWSCAWAVSASMFLLPPSGVSAQTALLVATTDGTPRDVEAGIAEGLRDGLGVSVRRVEPSLDDLALAAGCAEAPDSPSCVSRVAQASSTRWVAVEEITREGATHRVTIDLRRGSDGASIRVLRLSCTTNEECSTRLSAMLGDEPTAVVARSESESRTSPTSGAAVPRDSIRDEVSPSGEATSRADHGSVWQGATAVPMVLFASAAAASIGAMIAGGALISAEQARGVVAATGARRDQEVMSGLDANVAVAVGVGTGFALLGACLAGTGALVYALSPHEGAPRVSAAAGPTGGSLTLSMVF